MPRAVIGVRWAYKTIGEMSSSEIPTNAEKKRVTWIRIRKEIAAETARNEQLRAY